MTREFVALPADAVRRPDEVGHYLQSQRLRPATEDDHVLSLNAALEGWNKAVTSKRQPDYLVRWAIAGDTVQVWMPDHVVAVLLEIVKDMIRPGAALYDADNHQLTFLGERYLVEVDIGGVQKRSSLVLEELHDWVPRLHQLAPTPFLIVGRRDDPDSFVQTYRGSPLDPDCETPTYTLEFADGSPDRLYTTEVADPARVADLIWDWIEDRWDRLYRLSWQRYGSRGMVPVPSLRNELNHA